MSENIHILGICGTFMGGVAALARELGFQVEGSDQNVYPPMSTQLEQLGIKLKSGYSAENLFWQDNNKQIANLYVVGNALSRGNIAIEHILNHKYKYVSGPQWLGETLLSNRDVLAVAGTHGKTTTTSMLAWILDYAKRDPGFLVGGIPHDFGVSARIGSGKEFVVEADEYDTAFFDKRSKFVHYHPKVAILNNLEYDHADIFPDVGAIQRQFHHLIRTVPGNGCIIVNAEDRYLREVIGMGRWSPVQSFSFESHIDCDWRGRLLREDASEFEISHNEIVRGTVRWSSLGRHNAMNGLAAIAAAHAVGVEVQIACEALSKFRGAKRRLEVVARINEINIYDDFAHHPTAIQTTLDGLRARVGKARIIVAMEPRSNSMRMGAHADMLARSLALADHTLFLAKPELPWDAAKVVSELKNSGEALASVDELLVRLKSLVKAGDHVVFMSNGGFENAPQRFANFLKS